MCLKSQTYAVFPTYLYRTLSFQFIMHVYCALLFVTETVPTFPSFSNQNLSYVLSFSDGNLAYVPSFSDGNLAYVSFFL